MDIVDVQATPYTFLPAVAAEIHAYLPMSAIMTASLALETQTPTVAQVASITLASDSQTIQPTAIVTLVSIHSLHPITVLLTTTTPAVLHVPHVNVMSQTTVSPAKKAQSLIQVLMEFAYVRTVS